MSAPAKPADDIPRSASADAYHVADARRDVAQLWPTAEALRRADAIMTLATAVGISTRESRMLVAAKLDEWFVKDGRINDLVDDFRSPQPPTP